MAELNYDKMNGIKPAFCSMLIRKYIKKLN